MITHILVERDGVIGQEKGIKIMVMRCLSDHSRYKGAISENLFRKYSIFLLA